MADHRAIVQCCPIVFRIQVATAEEDGAALGRALADEIASTDAVGAAAEQVATPGDAAERADDEACHHMLSWHSRVSLTCISKQTEFILQRLSDREPRALD